MALGIEVGLNPGEFVLDGDPGPLAKRRRSPPPQFSAHVYSGQTAGWIQKAIGMEMEPGWHGGGGASQFSANSYIARNARIASAVLATAIPSVRLSVIRRYCVKTTARSTVQFAPLDSKMCLVL